MFRLLRYFSLTSAIAILSMGALLVALYRHHAVNELVENAENQSTALARSFANTIWPRFSGYVTSVSGLDGDALRTRPETQQIHDALKALAAGLPVLKVKVYNLHGLTVFSSQASQIGADKSDNRGFLSAARDGRPASKLAYKEKFSAFTGEYFHRDLVESYVPIRFGDGPIEGVFELYTDVTPLVARIAHFTVRLAVVLLLAFGLLYAVLFLIVRRADRILKQQYVDLTRGEQALQEANREMEAFSYSVSHDLRAPLRAIDGFSRVLLDEHVAALDDEGRDCLKRIRDGSQKMGRIIDAVLKLSKLARGELNRTPLDLSRMVASIAAELKESQPGRDVTFKVAGGVTAAADGTLIKVALQNLLANAVKFTGKTRQAMIEFGVTNGDGRNVYYVRDNGAGFDMSHAETLFAPFQRAHDASEFEGTGIGLATVQRIIKRHSGMIWAQAEKGAGATFFFTLPQEG